MNNFDVPILFLIFNRPDTTQKVFNVIKEIKPKKLFVAADGPRIGREGETILCQKTRDIIKQINWDCELKTLFRENNLGCGKSVSSAITWFFENVEEGIILEDDCLPNVDFFYYCKELLEYYRNDNRVMSIGGNNFQNGKKYGEASYYFSIFNHIWGWATWKRTWNSYDFKLANINKKEMKKIIKKNFFIKYQVRYWNIIFKRMKRKNPIDTWDYQLTFSIWKNNGLSIIPNVNLVTNIGFGEDATHTKNSNSIAANIENNKIIPIIHPNDVIRNKDADQLYGKISFTEFKIKGIIKIIIKKIIKIIKKIN